ncbi:MAG TPA: squalene/phytoene synthase family protein [Anaerolineae bacterium]|nr:squalene/phytoene synthase family protein [Anaerolineae bacterium]
MPTLSPQTWEHTLLARAYEAWHSVVTVSPTRARDTALLNRAYAFCEAVTAAHSKSFDLATRLLPADKRRAMRALYAFCRVSDNIVDCPCCDAETSLAIWRQRALSSEPPRSDLVALAWTDTRLRYRIPQRYAEQLIDGVARDLRPIRYRVFEELAAYAYGVASTVGLMSMHIIGFSTAQAIPYAIKLGVALQLTNILRDVGEDGRAGRVYLPAEELAAYGLTEADLAAGRVDDRWRAFMRFQIERNRRLYAEAQPGIAVLNSDGRFAVAAAAELYRAILDDIEAHDYDVFNRRARVSGFGKLRRLPGIWRRAH